MAGHSQFKNIMHRKGAQDAKRAKLFTKLLREVFVAAKAGPDPAYNPRLRAAINAAKVVNIPKDRIQNAMDKAINPANAESFEEIRYEGYGPNGIAVIVEALTDSRNRTAAEVRSLFTKYGGSLGETGSVNFLFNRIGLIVYPKTVATEEQMFESALEVGASDCATYDECHEIICEPESFGAVRDGLEAKYGPADSSQLTWKPLTLTILDAEGMEKIQKLIDALEDSDDVQTVISNCEF